MLLKIITWRGLTRVITGIEDSYIHQDIGYYSYESLWAQARDKFSPEDCEIPSPPHCLDEVGQQSNGTKNSDLEGRAGLIDYKKNGYWFREIISNHAYLCNDEGKTIAKINC